MRTLLIQASLPPRFWVEGLHTATYLLNRLPSTVSPIPTPHHALFGTPPTYTHLRVFGCACFPNLGATTPHKLAPHSTCCVFLGYSHDHKGYRCYDLTSRRVLISRHVVFDESDFPFSSSSTPTPDPDIESMFSDPVVQLPVSVFPFSTGSFGTPPVLAPPVAPEPPPAPPAVPVPFVAPDVGLVPSMAPVSPVPLAAPPAASVPTAPLAEPHVAPTPPPAPRVAPPPPARYAEPVRVFQRRPVPPPLPPSLAPPPVVPIDYVPPPRHVYGSHSTAPAPPPPSPGPPPTLPRHPHRCLRRLPHVALGWSQPCTTRRSSIGILITPIPW
jgi:hypothetical protein